MQVNFTNIHKFKKSVNFILEEYWKLILMSYVMLYLTKDENEKEANKFYIKTHEHLLKSDT